jgi:hypothetical protein
MSTGGDASVDQMLRFFEAFLAAAGYVLKGDLQVVEPLKDPWEGHYGSKAVGGSQATDFVISSDTSVATDIFNYSPSGIPGPHPPFGDDYSHLLNFK